MKKSFFLIIEVFAFSFLIFAQNSTQNEDSLVLPEVVTVISGDSLTVQNDLLPDFSTVIENPESFEEILPVLPELEISNENSNLNLQNEDFVRDVFAEGFAALGWPSVFSGNFSVFKLFSDNPFSISFSHESANGYSLNPFWKGFDFSNTNVFAEKTFKNKIFKADFSGSYNINGDGFQNKVSSAANLNRSLLSGNGEIQFDLPKGFEIGLNSKISSYNRFSDIIFSEDSDSENQNWTKMISLFGLNANLFAKWTKSNFEISLDSKYSLALDSDGSINEFSGDKVNNRGNFELGIKYSNEIINIFGNSALVIGNKIGENSFIVPFSLKISAFVPSHFSDRKVFVNVEGGLKSNQTLISELENNYKFTGFSFLPDETTDWYGKFNATIPVLSSFTLNVQSDFSKTAFGNGKWQPLYNSICKNGLYEYQSSEFTNFSTNISIMYSKGIFSFNASWNAFWIDVPVLLNRHTIFAGIAIQDENSRFGLELSASFSPDSEDKIPLLYFDAFFRVNKSVTLELSAEDFIKLVTAKSRIYAGDYISTSGLVLLGARFSF